MRRVTRAPGHDGGNEGAREKQKYFIAGHDRLFRGRYLMMTVFS